MALHGIATAATQDEQPMRCWTCNSVKPESLVRACMHPHCTGRSELTRCSVPTEIRPPKDNGGGGTNAAPYYIAGVPLPVTVYNGHDDYIA